MRSLILKCTLLMCVSLSLFLTHSYLPDIAAAEPYCSILFIKGRVEVLMEDKWVEAYKGMGLADSAVIRVGYDSWAEISFDSSNRNIVRIILLLHKKFNKLFFLCGEPLPCLIVSFLQINRSLN